MGGVATSSARTGVVAGYSYGASLAFSYAADARRWHLPQPRAVDCIFPAGPVAGVELDQLPADVRVLLQVGDRDTEAGRGRADPLARPAIGDKIQAARHSISMDNFEVATVTGYQTALGQLFVQFRYDPDGETGELAWPSAAIRPAV
jgi:hypothetical protein